MAAATTPAQRSWFGGLLDRILGWRCHLPAEQNAYTKQAVKIPPDGDDGLALLADIYQPLASNRATDHSAAVGTILVQTPYGRSMSPFDVVLARMWAARGYNVLLVSTRGTFGSGEMDRFDPGQHDQTDAIRVVRWMREQSWYTGSFATLGMSYLGFTQYSLMDSDDPLDDYAAAIIQVAPHDFSELIWGTGSLWLALIDWADFTTALQTLSVPSILFKIMRANQNGHMPSKKALPMADGVRKFLSADSPSDKWIQKWLVSSREDTQADPRGQWKVVKHGHVLEKTKVPILLLSGWMDLFARFTLEQYQRLHARGANVALTMGPWHHGDATEAPYIYKETWDWLETYLSKRAPAETRQAPVRIDISGSGETRWLQSWPPAAKPLELYLDAPGRLSESQSEKTDQAQFKFDPHDPTPTFGGPLLFKGGYVDDSALAKRADVLSFDSAPLDRDVEVMGKPIVEILHSSDNPHVDLFVRLSDVNGKGVSRNVCEVYRRLDPGRAPDGKAVRIELDLVGCAHVFKKGSVIRLMVAGGCFPHYAFNLGTGENQGTGTTLRPATHTVFTGGDGSSKLVLPVS